VTAMTPVTQIITLTGLIDHLATRGLGAGEAAEIAHQAFRLGIESVKPKKKPKQLGLVDKETTWPDGFSLTEGLRAYATANGFAGKQIDDMWEDFGNHHRKKASRFARWDFAWRTWVRNQVKFAEQKNAARSEADTYIDGRL
jgi:hypothetical protein